MSGGPLRVGRAFAQQNVVGLFGLGFVYCCVDSACWLLSLRFFVLLLFFDVVDYVCFFLVVSPRCRI